MPVRSTSLFNTSVAAGAVITLYTVPSGRTLIVRTLRVTRAGIGSVQLGIQIGGQIITLHTVGSNSTVDYGYFILNPGDVLRAQNLDAVNAVRVYGAGSLLLGAPS